MYYPYITGHDQGCDYAASDNSLSVNMNEFSNIHAFQQQQRFTGQGTSSPMTRRRRDSVNSQLSPQALRMPLGQDQAANQPCGPQMTPHIGAAYPFQSTDMSRGTSYASHRSSSSSGQQYGSEANFVPHHSYPSIHSPFGTEMRRSRSAYSPNAVLHSHQTSPQSDVSQLYRLPIHQYDSNHSDERTGELSPTMQHGFMNISLNNIIIDQDLIGLNGVDHVENAGFGNGPNEHLFAPILSTQQPQRRHNSFGGYAQRPDYDTVCSVAQAKVPIVEYSVSSTSTDSPPADQQVRRRPRKRSPPSDSESEQVTGHVLASGKFKCSDPKCEELRFGRQADFRRHYTNVHAEKILEYFCPIAGCERSRKPAKKSKGRSFKGRKDKMEEHVQTVHQKLSKKRSRSSETESEDEEDTEDNEQPQPKTQRQF